MDTRDWRRVAQDVPEPDRTLSVRATTSEDTWRLFAVGDVKYRHRTRSDAPIGRDLASRADAAAVSMANLEAPVAGHGEPLSKSGPTNAVDPEVPAVLAAAGFDVATLANNHAMDYGPEGLAATIDACEDEGLKACGAGASVDDAMEPARFDVEPTAGSDGEDDPSTVTVDAFSFCEREFGVADGDDPGTAPLDSPTALDRVRESDADVVVVVAHGGVEFVPFPPRHRRRRLREFVDAGADLVVGHHPHVPQGWEVYDDAPIFYSLGNFLFPMPERPKTQWGLAIDATLDAAGVVDVTLLPTETTAESVRAADATTADETAPCGPVVDAETGRDGGVDAETGRDGGVDAETGGVRRGDAEAVTAGEDAGDLGRVDAADRRAYLHRLADLTADREQVVGYWQTIAVDVFRQRYARWLRRAVAGDFASQLKQPEQHVDRDVIWDTDRREPQMLALLNLLRNPSHRSLMETALEVQTGKRSDERTDAVREEARALLDETEDEPVRDRNSEVRETLDAVLGRLS